MSIRILLGFLGFAVPTACAMAQPITGVTVRDANFEVVKTLSSAEIAEFDRHWAQRVEIDVSGIEANSPHYKLDLICGGDRGGRWIYHTSGHVTLLSKTVQPAYELADPQSFNRLIGSTSIDPQPSTLNPQPLTTAH
ncbi:MAG: hypothetical protein WD069_04280 [Planctomycetales bacterium]